jgi:hypothetical protein
MNGRTPPGIGSARFGSDVTRRYWLRRVWDRSCQLAVWVMLNPSVGSAARMDPTLWRVSDFSKREGFGGFHVVNLYARVATDPRALFALPAPDRAGPLSDPWQAQALTEAINLCPPPEYQQPGIPLIVAWGNHGHESSSAQWLVSLARVRGVSFVSLGQTSTGAPRHPLRIPRTTKFREWPWPF